VDRTARLGSHHCEVWSAPDPTSAGVGSQILSHILGIRSKSSILNLAAGSSGTSRKAYFVDSFLFRNATSEHGPLNDPTIRETDDGCILVAVI
jgi:hypothetical protein